MIKSIILLLLVLVFVALTNRIGEAVHAADSGVSLGVTVLRTGPPTINDFNYSSLNISEPIVDSGSIENTNSDPVVNQADPFVDSGSVKGAQSNQNLNQTVTGSEQGVVKGVTSDKPSSWFKNFINKFVNFFKRIF